MKKVMILLFCITAVAAASGQSAKFGIKGGLNFGSTGDITTISNETFNGENQLGYHLGVLARFKFSGIFLQPEVVYTQLETEFEGTGAEANYSLSKIDIPILLGLDIVGPLNIKAGPAFQLLVNNELELEGITAGDPENSFTIGYQIGAGLQLGSLGIDLRYESAFGENNSLLTEDVLAFASIDNRPSQWILSVSYVFNNNAKK